MPMVLTKTRQAPPPDPIYYPRPESSGGWRSLHTKDSTPNAGAKALILSTTGVDWDLLKLAWDYVVGVNASAGLLVIRHGWIVGEWGYAGPGTVHSGTKSITAMVVSWLEAVGRLTLDDAIADYLPASFDTEAGKADVTVRQLITMASAIEPIDSVPYGTLAQEMARPLVATPGTQWGYSSHAACVAGEVARAADLAGRTAKVIVEQEFCRPLGIPTPMTWPTQSPWPVNAAGGSEWTTRNFARIGYLMLHGGQWDSRTGGPFITVLPSAIVTDLMTRDSSLDAVVAEVHDPASPFTPPANMKNHYGHFWWTNNGNLLGSGIPADAAWAYGFQDIHCVIISSLDLVVVKHGPSGTAATAGYTQELLTRVVAAIT